MIEKIYTIPVSEAFETDSECPVCLLESRFESERIAYYLGASLMEPDNRIETNKSGFCRRHFEKLYNTKSNTLGLALIIETHLSYITDKLKKASGEQAAAAVAGKLKSIFKPGNDSTGNPVSGYISRLSADCCICKTLDYTMNRYFEVIFHLWKTETDFRKLYNSKKGFCLPHYGKLLDLSVKYLPAKYRDEFIKVTTKMEMDNLERIYDEVKWFTQKFDYRFKDEPWGNSKDAVPRSIQKICGYMDLE